MTNPTTDYVATNDWPPSDEQVGYWIAKLKVQELRDAIEALVQENKRLCQIAPSEILETGQKP